MSAALARPASKSTPSADDQASSNTIINPIATASSATTDKQMSMRAIVVNPLSGGPTAAAAPPRPRAGVLGDGGSDLTLLSTWPPLPLPERTSVDEYTIFFILRFRILVTAVPLALLVILIRWVNFHDGGAEAGVEAVVLPPLITAAVFVMATVLSNVMADYKESEKVPAEIVSYFNTLVAFARAEAAAYGFDELPMLLNIEDMLLCVFATLDRKLDFHRGLATFHEAFVSYCVYAKGQARYSNNHIDLLGPEHAMEEIVKKWTRIHDIGRLSIILPGYTLMDMLTTLLVALLASVKYKEIDSSANWAIVIFATIIIYLNVLVRALDDPFDGPEEYHFKCYAHGMKERMTPWEAFNFGLAIDFECLSVDFGSVLRRLIHEHGALPAAGASARGGGVSDDGRVLKRGRSVRTIKALGEQTAELRAAELFAAAVPSYAASSHGAASSHAAPSHDAASSHAASSHGPLSGKPLLPPGWSYSVSSEGKSWFTSPDGKAVWAEEEKGHLVGEV